MGSAVSAVTGAVQGAVSGVGDLFKPLTGGGGGGIENLISGGGPLKNLTDPGSILGPLTGGLAEGIGGSIGGIAKGIIGDIGAVPLASDQQAASKLASNIQQGNAASQMALAKDFIGQAGNQFKTTQGALGQSQGALTNAQNMNTGGNVANSLGLLQAQAMGTAPSAAEAQLQSGKNQAIAAQQAMANSGNLSQMVSGQKTAMDNAANLTQQAANQATQLQAVQQQAGQQNYANAAATQAQAAQANASLQQQQAAQQAGLYNTQLGTANNLAGNAISAQGSALGGINQALQTQQTALGQTGQNQAMAVGGLLNAAGGAVGGMAAASDENLKTDIKPATREQRAKAIASSFGDKPSASVTSDDEKNDNPSVEPQKRGFWGSEESQKKSETISAGFSDEKGKKDIHKGDKVAAFLDAIDPVTFKYKESDGTMGRTPGTHIGVIAQQVEKAPGGKSMVIETPEGKAIDLASAVGTLLAAAAESHDRVKQLEDLFNSKKKK